MASQPQDHIRNTTTARLFSIEWGITSNLSVCSLRGLIGDIGSGWGTLRKGVRRRIDGVFEGGMNGASSAPGISRIEFKSCQLTSLSPSCLSIRGYVLFIAITWRILKVWIWIHPIFIWQLHWMKYRTT